MEEHRKIVWLASYPKSGNTWLRMFLESYYLGEEFDINDIVTSVSDDYAGLYQIGDDSNIVDMPIQIQQLARPMSLLRLVRQHNKVSRPIPLFVKTHQAHMVVNGIELLPEALTQSVIYIVRDPRDVLPSFAKHMGMDLDEALGVMDDRLRHLGSKGTRCAETISSWDAHVNSFINADTHNVKYFLYEDLLKDPKGQFRKMLEHAGVDVDEHRLEQAVKLTELSNLKKKEKSEGFKESSPHAKNSFFGKGGSKNRNKLTPRQLHLIEKRYGRIMKRLGYLKQKVA